MPAVPRVTAPTVQTQVINQPTAQEAPAGAFGSPIGEAVIGVGQDFLKAKQNVDTAVAEDALVKFERDKNDILFNPETGYFNSQGKNAIDGSKGTLDSMDALRKKYMEGMSSQQAQQMFGRASAVHVNRSRDSIMKHAAKGQRTFDIANQQAAQENSIEGAALYWNDQEEMTLQNVTGREAVMDQAQMEGLGAEATAERLQTYESAFARTAIEAALDNGDIETAQTLTDRAEKTNRLEGPDLNIVNSKIEAETDKRDVLIEVDRIYSSGMSRSEMLEDVRKIDDPDKRKEAERILTNQLNADKVAFDESRRETYDARWKAIDAGQMTYSELSLADREILSPSQLQNLQKAEQVRMSGSNVPDNYILMRELESMSRNEQAKLQSADYVGKLSTRQMNSLTSLISAANQGGGESVRTKAATATAGVTAILGRKPKPKSASDQLLVNTFNELLEDEIAALEGNKPTGQKVTPQEITDISNRLSRKFVEEDALLGFIDQERTLKSIPVNHQIHVPQIADELRKAGYAVTPENIFHAYQTAVNVGDIE